MSARSLFVALSVFSLTALAEEGPDVRDWTAPPYWTARPSGGAGEAVEAATGRGSAASSRQALLGPPVALPFIALPPCRLVDTRAPAFPAPLGGGYLPPATVRSYTLTGVCGLPANAQAVSLNATVVKPAGPGFLTLYPQGGVFPPVSTLNYLGNDVIVNAAVVPLSVAGGISMALGVSGGDVVLDTNGYYAAVPDVASLNGLTGNVTLLAGANVTITPAGSTLTIASSGAQGPAGATGPMGPTGPPGPNGWAVTGNAGTNPATNFLGTTDNQAFEIKVNGQRVGRFEPAFGLPNVILGDRGNSVLAGATMATVSGGGWASLFGAGDGDNIVTGSGGTVGGGVGNQAGDDDGNTGTGQYITVGGGFYNTAAGEISTIGGGHLNTAPGGWSTVPGGYSNQAGGNMSLAAGNSAKVRSAAQTGSTYGDYGTFVWADSPAGGNSGVDFVSTGVNQFLVRAGGGVGINTNNPSGFTLAVNGTAAKPGGGTWSTFSDARLKRDVRPLEGTLERLLALRGVRFEYIDPEALHEPAGTRIGMLAQEVERVFPDWVSEGPDGYRRLSFSGFEALTVEALRDLRKEKDAEIAALRAALEAQRGELEALRGAVERIRGDLPNGRSGR